MKGEERIYPLSLSHDKTNEREREMREQKFVREEERKRKEGGIVTEDIFFLFHDFLVHKRENKKER